MKKDWTYYTERSLSILSALILLQTLFYKFTAHPESVYIFSEIGIEPWGRIGIGILELFAGGLLLFRSVSYHGALLAIGLMSGALFFHMTNLGIDVQHDGGQLFYMAVFVLLASVLIIVLRKKDIQDFIDRAKQAK